MAKYLTIFATVIIFSGCCSVPPHVPVECPPRPVFSDYSQDLWSSIPEQAQVAISNDDLAMKQYILACEARMRIHNEG